MIRRTAATMPAPPPAAPDHVIADRASLRERLAEMARDLAQSLDERIDGGVISLLGSIHLAMLALDALDAETGAEGRQRAKPLSSAAAENSVPANRQASLLPAIGVPGPAGNSRAVVADDGQQIILTIYRGADVLAAAVLDPVGAIGLAGELIEAAHLRLADAIFPRKHV